VSSGSVAMGRRCIKTNHHQLLLEQKQAAAACGQIALIAEFQNSFARHNLPIAQLLLTIPDTENRRRYLNAKDTINNLLSNDVIPIINENDTVATNEIRFGDNDRLAARIAQMTEADVLILLSDIDGLYTDNPHTNKNAQHVDEVREITPEIENMGGDSVSNYGSGGMVTKISAAKIATDSGCHMAITLGKLHNPIKNLLAGGKCTWFVSGDTPNNAKKNWIANNIDVNGTITLDAGAVNAIENGNSLLAAGIIAVSGVFDRGDIVDILDSSNEQIARGIIAYNNHDTDKIKGEQSSQIPEILGFANRDYVIHRDNLVILRN
jgi:glutamate 5-kinase